MTDAPSPLPALDADQPPVLWVQSQAAPVPYLEAMDYMDRYAEALIDGRVPEMAWLLEHPPLYTGGTSAKPTDVIDAHNLPVFEARRGGQYTYHGPGQRVVYLMLDLRVRGRDLRRYVTSLEAWIIGALDRFNVTGLIRPDRVGVWVDRSEPRSGRVHEDKIAAIGVRSRKWVTSHGIALNVEPDLRHFAGIVPCGISTDGFGVTSLVDLGLPVTMAEADDALARSFRDVFGPLQKVSALPDLDQAVLIRP